MDVSDLITELSDRDHDVEVQIDFQLQPVEFAQLNRIPVTFTDLLDNLTLDVQLEKQNGLVLALADLANRRGTIMLHGTSRLQGVPVYCVAKVDLATLTGRGHCRRA